MKVRNKILTCGAFLSILFLLSTGSARAAEFHVIDATEFQNALDAAENNGEDDTIYLAAGTYQGGFSYRPPDTGHKSLTITGESGTPAHDIILDGQNSGRVLELYDDSDGPGFEITVNGITVENGNSTGMGHTDGGGIKAIVHNGNIFITNCIIQNNTAKGYGGGIYMNPGKHFNLENNLVVGNTVTEASDRKSRGGGAALIIPGGDYNTIRNNIVAGNTAQGTGYIHGGGLFLGWSTGATIHLIGNTIYDNQASGGVYNKGGGVYFFGAWIANVYNNIIYENTAIEGGDIYFRTGYITNRIGYNNDYSDMYGMWTESGNNVDSNPLLVDPANNDFHLQPTSPMIDAGTTAVPEPPGLPTIDFEGDPRISGVAPDIGADEFVRKAMPWLQLLLLDD